LLCLAEPQYVDEASGALVVVVMMMMMMMRILVD